MTLEEITAREDQLLHQIAERQHLLAAYQRLRTDCQPALPAARNAVPGGEPEPQAHMQSAPPPVPPTASVQVVPAPNLAQLRKGYGGTIRLVTWAIRQVIGDFTVRDLASVTQRAGYPLRVAKVSVVLNRMKDEHKIEELKKGRGRTPSLFRATAGVTTGPLEWAARHRRGRLTSRYRIVR
jgi:hypothetical protein